jgi:hypothetical protein
LGLTAETLWGLCRREYDALKRQWAKAREWQSDMVAVVRADLHNTSARKFDRVFSKDDFKPGASVDSIHKLVAQGYTPSQAAAIATSKQSSEHKIFAIDKALKSVQPKSKRSRRAG